MSEPTPSLPVHAAPPGAPLTWVADVPLLTNPVILRGGALMFAGAYVLITVLFAVILATEGDLDRLPRAMSGMFLGFGVVGLLVGLVMLVVFQNRMRCRFILDDDGFGAAVIDRRAEIGTSLAAIVGAGAGNATLAGAGLLGRAARREYTRWDRVAAVRFRPERHQIITRAATLWPVGALHCSRESYPAVADRVRRIAESRKIAVETVEA